MTKKEVTQLSYDIIGYAIKVHKFLGPGLIESVYENCLKYELEKNGYQVIQQLYVPIIYDRLELPTTLKLDLLVNDCIVVELKTAEQLIPVYDAQLMTYMNLLQKPMGLLINFFSDNITRAYKPFVNHHFSLLPEG